MTPAQRSLRAKIAANTRWAKTPDRAAATAKARAALVGRWEKKVDPDGVLSPADRALLAVNARNAHCQSMALKSAAARRKKRKPAA